MTETELIPGKVCSACSEAKALTEFHGNGRAGRCKICVIASERARRLRRMYGITEKDYYTVLSHQGGVCAICKRPPKKVRLSVDHCHKTGLTRGLLCSFCNRVIGLFRDDIEKFRMSVVYLSFPPATSALKGPRWGMKGRVTNKASTRKMLNRPTGRPVEPQATENTPANNNGSPWRSSGVDDAK